MVNNYYELSPYERNEKTVGKAIHNNELQKKYAQTKIEDMDLSVRSYNCLKRAGIDDLQQLAKLGYDDFRKIRNLGNKGVHEIIERLNEYGFDIRQNDEVKNNG